MARKSGALLSLLWLCLVFFSADAAAICLTNGDCSSSQYCSLGSCLTRKSAGQSCTGIGQGNCASGLVCDVSGVCRHDPPTAGEPCGIGVSCASGLTCSASVGGVCQAPKQAGDSCTGIGQGNCASGLVCDVSGVCRHDPPTQGEPCGTGVSCASGLACSSLVAGTCQAPKQAGDSCIGLGQGNCDSGLVCDVSGVCRHDPPTQGEPCGTGVSCATGLACSALAGGVCIPPRTAGQSCVGLGQGNCESGLVCDAGSATCRHDPPELGETCGVLVPCASGLTCYAGQCKAPSAAGGACDPLVGTSCQSGLVCDVGSLTCRHDPPQLGETCGLLVPCASGLTCYAAQCKAPSAAGGACDPTVGTSCQSGLVCDVGSLTCRHDPPQLGETCGVLVPCAAGSACYNAACIPVGGAGDPCDPLVTGACQTGLLCDAGSGTCRHNPPQAGETCGVLVPCASGLTCIAASCVPRAAAGQSCDVLVADSCQAGLVCDPGNGKCRHDPPQLGETCGVLVPCASGLACYNAACVAQGGTGDPCDPLVTNSCQAGLVCDFGDGRCRHDPPTLGETCGVLVPCASGLQCFNFQCVGQGGSGDPCDPLVANACQSGLTCDIGSGTCRHDPPQLGETCGVLVPCDGGLTCIAAQCVQRAAAGEQCDLLVADSCQSGLVCDAGDGKCRHDPPTLGETCGVLVPCASGLACYNAACIAQGSTGDPCDPLVANSCQSGLVCDFGDGRCRHDPPQLGETCGVLVPCASGLACYDFQCINQGAAGDICDPLVANACQSGLLCDAGSHRCRHDPPQLGETCGLLVPCAGNLVCFAATCVTPGGSGTPCDPLVANSCSGGLICDIGSGTCRHDPPELGETCGLLVPCASGVTCYAGQCVAPGSSGTACDPLVSGSCQAGLLCDAGSGTCRHDPPQLGETCGLLVPCATGLSCFAAQCVQPGAAGERCDPLVTNSCQSGLLCDVGSFTCRHDPPQLGETCGLLVPCETGLACFAAKCVQQGAGGDPCDPLVANSCQQGLLCDAGSGTCRHDPPRQGETCGLLVPCVSGLTCVNASCVTPGSANASCNLLVAGSCQSGLVCDLGTSLCRHNPPLAGESCGGLIQCSGSLTCLNQTCVNPGTAGDSCDPLVGSSCVAGLVCDAGARVCRHDPPLYGERCGPAVPCAAGVCDAIGECRHDIPELGEPCGIGVNCTTGLTCASAAGVGGRCVVPAKVGEACIGFGRGSCETGLVCDISGECRHSPPRRGEPCGQFVTCATGLACDSLIGGRCATPRKVGQTCIGLGQGNCESGASCNLTIENGNVMTKCFPSGNGIIPPNVCKLFYSRPLSNSAGAVGTATTFGTGGGGGAGPASTLESGVVYGPNGEYGCYNTICGGVLTDVSIAAGVCAGLYNTFGDVAGDSSVSVQSVTPLDEGPTFSTAQVFTPLGNPMVNLIGTADCLSLGVGILPLDVGVYNCTTQVTTVVLDSNNDGILDSDTTALNLNPVAPNGDTDGDGIADVIEIGGNINQPLDSDNDGVIDALEAGNAATDATVAGGVPLVNGNTVTITTGPGERLSSVGTTTANGGPAGVSFPFGVISYETTAPIGGSVVVQLVFSEDLPANPVLYKVDYAGTYHYLPRSLWEMPDSRTLLLTLTDGDAGTDLDGMADGVIDDPITVAAATGSGHGGGCTLRRSALPDPLFPLLLPALAAGLLFRRRMSRQ